MLPDAGPGLAPAAAHGLDTAGMPDGDLTAFWLLHTDPLRDLPNRPGWTRALDRATTVVAHAAFLTEGIRKHATVVFPAESHAEKEGTMTHPDGRVQRLRPAIGHQGDSRFEWQVIADISARLGLDLNLHTAGMAFKALTAAVPFYAGLTLDGLGGRGVRWGETEAASSFPHAQRAPEAPAPHPAAVGDGALRLGTFRSIWAAPEVEVSPALKFLHPRQRAELSPADAQRLKLFPGDRVIVGSDGHSVSAIVALRDGAPEGTVFLETAIPEDSASVLEGPLVEVRKA
jgi:NADH-quinone oxidoreductase subunit G